MASATIKLFLPHGDPKRLRTAEISNWSGKAIAAPRTDLDELLARDEASQSGVYVLTGNDPETGKPSAYIGEAEVLRDRIKGHRSRDSWVSVVAFLSKDENLTKAHIRFLEGKLIQAAKLTGRFVLENGVASGSRLPEADRHDMEMFLEKAKQLLPVLGLDLLTPISEPKGSQTVKLTTGLRGITANGQRTPSGFVVFSGSQAISKDRPSALPWSIQRREELRRDGTLVADGSNWRFTRDVEFSSPSAAGAVVHGGNVNGLIVWKGPGGKTLKVLESK